MARVALVGPEMEENLSLRYLSGFLKKQGHEAHILPFNGWAERDTVVRDILSADPQIAGLSMSFQYRGEDFIGLAEQLRRKGFAGHITAGGHFATFTYHEILNACLSIDSIIRFNGEAPLLGLAEALDRRLTVEGNLGALERLERFGIYPCYNILLLNPWTTLEEIRENIANLRRAPSHMPFNVCRTEIYHGTPLFERLSRQGRLLGSFMQPNYECVDPRAEALLRIMEAAFSHRSYDFHGSVNEAMSLGYEMSLAQRHYASLRGLRTMATSVRGIVKDTNAATLSLLEEMADFVAGAPLAKAEVEDFALSFAMRTARLEEKELAVIAKAHHDLEQGVFDLTQQRQKRQRERFWVERASYAAIPALALAIETASCNMPEEPAKPAAGETSGFSLESLLVGQAHAAAKKTKKDKKKNKGEKSVASYFRNTSKA